MFDFTFSIEATNNGFCVFSLNLTEKYGLALYAGLQKHAYWFEKVNFQKNKNLKIVYSDV